MCSEPKKNGADGCLQSIGTALEPIAPIGATVGVSTHNEKVGASNREKRGAKKKKKMGAS